jgi:hypothetical protein
MKIERGEEIPLSDIEYMIREAQAGNELKKAMRQALLDGNVVEALRLARQITGLPEEVKQ